MHYFALLLTPEDHRYADHDEPSVEIAAYQAFHASAAAAIRAGDALLPSTTGARITGGPDKPTITDGPFAEGAEVAGGYYVFEAENLDEALQIAGQIPAAKYGAIEIWPMVEWNQPETPLDRNHWLALLLEPAETDVAPDTPKFGCLHCRPRRVQHRRWRSRQGRRGAASAVDRDDGSGARR